MSKFSIRITPDFIHVDNGTETGTTYSNATRFAISAAQQGLSKSDFQNSDCLLGHVWEEIERMKLESLQGQLNEIYNRARKWLSVEGLEGNSWKKSLELGEWRITRPSQYSIKIGLGIWYIIANLDGTFLSFHPEKLNLDDLIKKIWEFDGKNACCWYEYPMRGVNYPEGHYFHNAHLKK